MKKRKTTVLHVITSLSQGGAEAMLFKLLSHMDSNQFENIVVSMRDGGIYQEKLITIGIPVYCLQLRKNPLSFISALITFKKSIKKHQPNIVQGWMYHGNFFSLLSKIFKPKTKIIFNIRDSITDFKKIKWLTRIFIKLNATFSNYVSFVLNNSKTSINQHAALGFSKETGVYIPNGFLTDEFIINSSAYFAFRKQYELCKTTKIIGSVSRFDYKKNHSGILEVFKKIKQQYAAPIVLVLAGVGLDQANKKLIQKIKSLGLINDCILLGSCRSAQVMPAFDVYLSASLDEGFPNVIGEAMACGVPCVATDVGDCREIISEYGRVFSLNDYDGMASACVKYLKNSLSAQEKNSIRQHIVNNYDIKNVVKIYERLYLDSLKNTEKLCVE